MIRIATSTGRPGNWIYRNPVHTVHLLLLLRSHRDLPVRGGGGWVLCPHGNSERKPPAHPWKTNDGRSGKNKRSHSAQPRPPVNSPLVFLPEQAKGLWRITICSAHGTASMQLIRGQSPLFRCSPKSQTWAKPTIRTAATVVVLLTK